MAAKTLIFPKFPLKAKVKFKFGHDSYLGWIVRIAVAPPGHMARKPGTHIYRLQIYSMNKVIFQEKVFTTAGEHELELYQHK